MTIIDEEKAVCPVCKNHLSIYKYRSICYWSSALLDGCRIEDPEPSMCPKCGYVSYDFYKRPKVSPSDLQTESYLTCDGYINVRGKKFYDVFKVAQYRYYLLSKMRNDYKEMYYSLRKCMHQYGKTIDEKLLPEVYSLFMKAFRDKLENKDKELIAVQIYYLRMLGRIEEAQKILNSIDFEDVSVQANRRLMFEKEMLEKQVKKVLDFEDYKEWEMPYLINIYGEEFDRRMRKLVGKDTPLLYHDVISGENRIDVARRYLLDIGLLGNKRISRNLVISYLHSVYLDKVAGAEGSDDKYYNDLKRAFENNFKWKFSPDILRHLRKKYIDDCFRSENKEFVERWLKSKGIKFLADWQYHLLYDMDDKGLDQETEDCFRIIRSYYADKLRYIEDKF